MKIICHIGLSKTGTSVIQNFCWFYKNILENNYKIYYPTTVLRGGIYAHYHIAWSVYKPLHIKVKSPSLEKLLLELKKEILQKRIEELIISCESFMLFAFSDEIYIIVYLRRQDLWIESFFSQVIKTREFDGNFYDSLNTNLDWLLKYDLFLNRWQNVFLKCNLYPRIYDKKSFPKGNVILDFLSIFEVYMPEIEIHNFEANPFLSVLSTLILQKINKNFTLTSQDHKKIVNYLLYLDREEGSPIKSFFTLPERIEFLEHFRESNERLFREWFGTENKFVLSEEEIKFYEEQDNPTLSCSFVNIVSCKNYHNVL